MCARTGVAGPKTWRNPTLDVHSLYRQGFRMVTRIQKWGNSLGLRIPKSFAKEAGVEEGSAVDISIDGNRLVIQPIRSSKYELKELLLEVREDNLHEEIPTGDAVGREGW